MKTYSTQPQLKFAAYCCLLTLTVLLVLAAVYWKERMLFTDASIISFRRINLQTLYSSQLRFGAFLTESVPILLAKLHLPLCIILIGYSVSFTLLYLSIALLLTFYFREYGFTVLFTLYYLLFVSEGYYWTNNEIHQAVAYLFLTLAIMLRMTRQETPLLRQCIIFVLLATLTVFTHPLAVTGLVFLWFFLWLDTQIWPVRLPTFLLLTLLLALVIAAKLWISAHLDYDGAKMKQLTRPEFRNPGKIFGAPILRAFFRDCLQNYWWAILLLAGSTCILSAQRHWLQLLISWGALLLFAGMISLTWSGFGYYDYHNRYYAEGEWQMASLFISAGVVFYLLPKLPPRLIWLLVTLICATRIYYIVISAPIFTKRVTYIEHLLQIMRAKGITKIIITENGSDPEQDLFRDWALATESMTLSALDGETPQRTIAVLWPEQLHRIPTSRTILVTLHWDYQSSQLNNRYFQLDTTSDYQFMNYKEFIQP